MNGQFTDSDHTEKLRSMLRTVPIPTYAIKLYMALRLRATVKFDQIKKVENSLRSKPPRMLIVLNHKQKILPINHGKKGVSMLETMEI